MAAICVYCCSVWLHHCLSIGTRAYSILHWNRLAYKNYLTLTVSLNVTFLPIELFESAPRPAAMALGSLSSWTCNFIVGMAFPSLQVLWNAFVFIPFAVVCFALAALLKFYLPETRGRDSSDIAPLVADGFMSRPLIR